MVSSTASTRKPPAGDPKAERRLDDLLPGLRRGERDAFVRYFRLFRAPVCRFALLMLGDAGVAADATSDALVRTFRRAVLDGDAGESGGTAADLEVMTYAGALETCEERLAPGAEDAPAGPPAQTAAGGRDDRPAPGGTALGRRFAAALGTVEPRRRAALVLHDVAGLDDARRAAVFGLTEAAGAALLFRAREDFRDALRLSDHHVGAPAACRQAEDAAAGAVGLGLGAADQARLQRHAEYCEPCRRVMAEWDAAGVGLAAVLVAPPLPDALSVAPVFGVADVAAVAGVTPVARPIPRVLARAARMARSRAAAWIVAAACVAAAAGVVMHASGVQPLFVMQSVGPAIRLVVAPPNDGSEPAEARPAEAQVSGPVVGLSAARTAVSASATTAGSSAPESPSSRTGATGGGETDGRQASESDNGAKAAAQTHGDGAGAKARDKAHRAHGKAGKAHGKAGKTHAGGDSRAAEKGKHQKAQGKHQKAHGKHQKAQGKHQKAHGKHQKAHGKHQKAHGKHQKAHGTHKASRSSSGEKHGRHDKKHKRHGKKDH